MTNTFLDFVVLIVVAVVAFAAAGVAVVVNNGNNNENTSKDNFGHSGPRGCSSPHSDELLPRGFWEQQHMRKCRVLMSCTASTMRC